jgi:RNA polymerase sigma-54 factor
MTKAAIQLRLGPQIIMTPQLQQAIRLLQLSSHELHQEIQQVLDSNIMLEMAEDEAYENADDQDLSSGLDEEESAPDTLADDIPKELAIDSDWEDIYDGTLSPYDYPTREANGKEQGSTLETLQDYLQWQLDLTPFSDLDRACATAIIDAIDSDGYLRASVEDIAQSLGMPVSTIETVLHRIQHFDPVGVGARDLRECLLLQLAEYEADMPWLKEAKSLVQNHLEVLGTHDYAQLTKRMMLSRDELREVVKIIQSLKPCPGAEIEPSQTTYVIPDVFVKKVKGQWKVELNSETSPKLRINAHYASLYRQIDALANKKHRDDRKYLRNHLQDARGFIKSLNSRHETLLKVAKCIVKRQSAFLEYGEEAMKPLVLDDIAKELKMHESTISRVTTQKYIHTPRGLFELKYFFSSHLNTNRGGECSSTAIRAMIKKLIAAENTAKPFSDNKIVTLLSERGIKVARRTVAKYREAMLIPPSNERKRLVGN